MTKKLLSLKEFSAVYSIGITKTRELARAHEGEFSLRVGGKIYVDVAKFDSYKDKCMQFGLPIC